MPRDFDQSAHDLFGPVRPRAGDAVIHIEYGLGLFEGIETVEVDGQAHEVARLAYAGGDTVMVPQAEFGSLWRYGRAIGVTFDTLKGSNWATRRDAALAEVESVAGAVVEAATARRNRTGAPLTPDAARYDAVCAGFGHTPTPSQAAAFSAVAEDLSSERAMDRILLGDVGFGKTEVILRAAAHAALAGQQVAIAVPTTVLCRQHVETLGARLAEAGLVLREYSTNVSTAERRETRKGLADGTVDIVVGTHGLTAKGVRFDRLGLVVIDEEHKFGARRKATLMRLCEGRNRLVTTATPIPKVLTAAEVGLLDLSVLSDAPKGRKPVETRVIPFDTADIVRALQTERGAGGRSYVICPRIRDIDRVRALLAADCPDLTVAVAHGRMKNAEVDAAMTAFAGGGADILLATALVENGLDIAAANTMVVLDADRFGLTQLHQLRGRIGRGERQAHMLICQPEGGPKGREPGDAAMERLALLADVSHPGAGFDIALADRNRRGGGDLLGEDQSGHLSALGPGYYRHLLRTAIMERRVADVAGPVAGERRSRPRAA